MTVSPRIRQYRQLNHGVPAVLAFILTGLAVMLTIVPPAAAAETGEQGRSADVGGNGAASAPPASE